jgi:hypothetical protein
MHSAKRERAKGASAKAGHESGGKESTLPLFDAVVLDYSGTVTVDRFLASSILPCYLRLLTLSLPSFHQLHHPST